MVVIVFGNFLEFRNVKQFRKIVEVEHRVVLTVLTKERHVLAQIHILQVIRNKASITTLYPLSKLT